MNSYRERRKRTGLNVKTFAKIIGSNECSVYNWEQGKTKPRIPDIEKNIDYLIEIIEYFKKNAKNYKKYAILLKKVIDIIK